jgi:hypothetical protein
MAQGLLPIKQAADGAFVVVFQFIFGNMIGTVGFF